jgi:hypothetical protein
LIKIKERLDRHLRLVERASLDRNPLHTALCKMLADGRLQVMGFACPGDIIGLGVQGDALFGLAAIRCQ